MKFIVRFEKYINFSLISNCIIFNTLAGCNKKQEGKKTYSGKPEIKVDNNNNNNNNNKPTEEDKPTEENKPTEEDKPKIPEDPFKDLREQLSTKLNNVNSNNNLLGINKLEINIKSEEIQTATENRLKEIQSELDKLDKEITDKLNNDENGKKLLLSNKINQIKNLFDEVENLNKQLVAKGGGEVKLYIGKSQIEGNKNVEELNLYDQELNKNKKEINEKIQIEDKKSKVNNLFSTANNLNNALPDDKKINLEISEGMIKSAYELEKLKDYENKLNKKINDINNTKKAIEEEDKKKAQELKDLQNKLNSSKPEEYIKNAIVNINDTFLKYYLNNINDKYKNYQESIKELNKNVEEKNEKTKELDNLQNIKQKIQNDKEELKNLYEKYALFTKEEQTINNINSILENVKNYDNKVVELKEKYKKDNMDKIRSKYNTERYKDDKLTGIFVSYLFSETSRIEFLESAFKDLKQEINDQSEINKNSCPYKEIKEISDLLNKAKPKDKSKKEIRDTDYISDDDVKIIKEAQIKYLDKEKEKLKNSNDLFYFLYYGKKFKVDAFMKIEDFTDKSNNGFIDYFYAFKNKEESMIKMIHDFFPREWYYMFKVDFYNKKDKEIKNKVENVFNKLNTKVEITETDYKTLENGSKDVKYNEDMIFMIKQYIEDGKFIAEKIKEYDKDYNDLHDLGNSNGVGKHTQDQINNDIKEIQRLTKKIDDTNKANPNLNDQITKLKEKIFDLNYDITNSRHENIKKEYNNLITEINDKYKDNEEFKKIKDTFNEKIKPIA